MKKIIDGKLYDTETATQLARMGNCLSGHLQIFETLYKKETGEYFLYGEGGACTRYSARCGNNMWSWGYKIIPLSSEEAKRWAEEHMDADAYMKEFGEVEE